MLVLLRALGTVNLVLCKQVELQRSKRKTDIQWSKREAGAEMLLPFLCTFEPFSVTVGPILGRTLMPTKQIKPFVETII